MNKCTLPGYVVSTNEPCSNPTRSDSQTEEFLTFCMIPRDYRISRLARCPIEIKMVMRSATKKDFIKKHFYYDT